MVLGDNGAGKSTLLRIVAGLMEPSQGSFTLLGARSFARSLIASATWDTRRCSTTNSAAWKTCATSPACTDSATTTVCRKAMQMVGLDPELSRRVGQYSQGMRQRLSLARAVLHDPELMLLDEPFSNVDVHSAREMAAVLGRVRDQGKTIFVVTHQAALMEGVADEFVHMAAGQIVARAKKSARNAAAGGLPAAEDAAR